VRPVGHAFGPATRLKATVKSPTPRHQLKAADLKRTICLALGQEQEERALGQLENESPQASAGLRLLVAEDNAVNQRVAVAILERLGHRVTVAGNGEPGLLTWS
jgi:hypothetical protein